MSKTKPDRHSNIAMITRPLLCPVEPSKSRLRHLLPPFSLGKSAASRAPNDETKASPFVAEMDSARRPRILIP